MFSYEHEGFLELVAVNMCSKLHTTYPTHSLSIVLSVFDVSRMQRNLATVKKPNETTWIAHAAPTKWSRSSRRYAFDLLPIVEAGGSVALAHFTDKLPMTVTLDDIEPLEVADQYAAWPGSTPTAVVAGRAAYVAAMRVAIVSLMAAR